MRINQAAELDKTSSNIEHMRTMCRVLRDEADSLYEINASVYLEKMKDLERGGAKFVNTRMTDMRKRRTGAIISAVVVISFLILVIGAMLYFKASEPMLSSASDTDHLRSWMEQLRFLHMEQQ